MLKLKDIVKDYTTGAETVSALKKISIDFRKSEFVAILGPSGCGKTTLLNIIGGLDQYTSGDLEINGVSTKKFKTRDWDTYRNHSVGFVFQSYNLIPHQSVLANVELALTISGVSKKERRKRAEEALDKVGLSDQKKKRPNQMSGGQMQRVAIARALVNNPDILLADEPTGALDTQTSIQVMEILKQISKDKLIIMVTHNPELAEKYANRTIKLLDGNIVGDTNPYTQSAEQNNNTILHVKKPSMSFFTALSLSLKNLMTKKGRTILTAFAGSIGIIGIALILSISQGINNFINDIQEDTLSSYPITINAESYDMTSMITTLMGVNKKKEETTHENDAVYTNQIMYNLMNSMNTNGVQKNNLEPFKKFTDSNTELSQYTSAIHYKYDMPLNIFTTDPNGTIIKSDAMELMSKVYDAMNMPGYKQMLQQQGSSFNVWEEILPEQNGEGINGLVKKQYDLVYGNWPEKYNQVVLILNERNEISDIALYTLGLETSDDIISNTKASMNGEQIDTSDNKSWSYEDICNITFKLISSPDLYAKNTDGTYKLFTDTETGMSYVYNNPDMGIDLKIVGIVKPNPDAISTMLTGSIGYTAALTDYVIKNTQDSKLVTEQIQSKDTDILTGLKFPSDTDDKISDTEKQTAVKDYFQSLSEPARADVYKKIMSTPDEQYIEQTTSQYLQSMTRDDIEQMVISAYAEQMGVADASSIKDTITAMDDETLYSYVSQMLKEQLTDQFTHDAIEKFNMLSDTQIINMFDSQKHTEKDYSSYYDKYMPSEVSESTYDQNLKLLGYIDKNKPSSISMYSSSFEDKDKISDVISSYNNTVTEDDKISYTDYVKLIMSSVTTIISSISYVLIAFVAISLVVSSIMIGIITYISVLERTKEIGILRSIGASKRDVSRVFNAETLIIGFIAGVFGIGLTLLLTIPINLILHAISGFTTLNAVLPVAGAVILVVISMLLTFIAGLIPSGMAAKKDPVEALRSE